MPEESKFMKKQAGLGTIFVGMETSLLTLGYSHLTYGLFNFHGLLPFGLIKTENVVKLMLIKAFRA